MTANHALDKYLSSLDAKEQIAKSRDIRELCRISRFVLCAWRRGRTPIPWVFLDKITEAIGENIFENVTN
ncbi:MAG: hypothetical protein K2H17_05930 [Duncaniella sp.]|uniref:hypothetical protein n=1 Tax=Duncaniella sp. TaxID=2518496 RepID=UPI0023BCEBE3|nr:hypothetical protein [Duncaniella sp.]MDE5988917.1 hypothetical protein [Duncaniella sp.]